MKKIYEKPKLYCEELLPESLLCGCQVRNNNFSYVEMCGYMISDDNLIGGAFSIFGETWSNCMVNHEALKDTEYEYCYHVSAVTLFSS